ncbi:MAG: 4-hydroxy-tetrahydrodipicolinate synthase, partial [Roseburia sp.]|nr:4-hydroxy-tetrahydrodipicolinate synthase [Roseburia sp.]
MGNNNLKGLGVALITPFKKDKSIDFEALAKIIDYQINSKIDFIVALGTTAETPTLSEIEKLQVRNFIKEKVNDRVPIVLGYGSNNTKSLVEQLKNDDLFGFSAILSVVPFYNKPTQEGIYQHFKAISEASPIPVILYNVPGRTGVNMSAETTLRLANDFNNIIGIKEASGNFT